MEIVTCELPPVSIVGMEGGAWPGHNPAPSLWEQANARFGEVEALALRDESGAPVGVWGAMSDLSRSFLPWGDSFTRGLYLAGIQVPDSARPPGLDKVDPARLRLPSGPNGRGLRRRVPGGIGRIRAAGAVPGRGSAGVPAPGGGRTAVFVLSI